MTHEPHISAGNALAACLRVRSRKISSARSQRRHDWRISRQPAYVDSARTCLNSAIFAPRPFHDIKKEIVELRKSADRRRKMRSDAAVVISGLIGFGVDAHRLFAELPVPAQDAALLDLAQQVATRLETRLESLVVHRDESAVHAHFELRGYTNSGQPVTSIATRSTLSDLQDITHKVLRLHCPGIERGHRKTDRLAAGANLPDVINKSVRTLHLELPQAIGRKLSELAAVKDDIAAQETLREDLALEIADLKADAEAKAAHREAHDRELAEREIKALERLELKEAEIEQAHKDADKRHAEAVDLEKRMKTGIAALVALCKEVEEGTFRFEGEKWRMGNPASIKGAPSDVMMALLPAIVEISTLKTRLDSRLKKMNLLHRDVSEWLLHPDLPAHAHDQGQSLSGRMQSI